MFVEILSHSLVSLHYVVSESVAVSQNLVSRLARPHFLLPKHADHSKRFKSALLCCLGRGCAIDLGAGRESDFRWVLRGCKQLWLSSAFAAANRRSSHCRRTKWTPSFTLPPDMTALNDDAVFRHSILTKHGHHSGENIKGVNNCYRQHYLILNRIVSLAG